MLLDAVFPVMGEESELVLDGSVQLRRAELRELVETRMASWRGMVSPTDRIGVRLEPTADAISEYLALLGVGASVVLLPRSAPEAYLAAARAKRIGQVVAESVARGSAETGAVPTVGLFTSGSTRQPRLVELGHAALGWNCAAILRTVPIPSDARTLLVLPLEKVFGLSVLHTHLRAGAILVVGAQARGAPSYADAAAKWDCTHFAGVPAQFAILTGHQRRRGTHGCLRQALQAGGAMSQGEAEEFRSWFPGCELVVMYGQTELGGRICVRRGGTGPEGSVGRPMEGIEIAVRDEEGRDVPMSTEGTIDVRSQSRMQGYWDSDKAFFDTSRTAWLDTGDVGYVDSDGNLFLTGRKSDFVKIAGERIHLPDVEAAVEAAFPDSVCDSLAFVGGSRRGRPWITLRLVARDGRPLPSDDHVRFAVRAAVGQQAAPSVIHAVNEIAYTDNGKKIRGTYAF
jgi:long-chain acyl-CoA synthetase